MGKGRKEIKGTGTKNGRVSGARERLWEGRMKKEAGYRGTLLPGNSHLSPPTKMMPIVGETLDRWTEISGGRRRGYEGRHHTGAFDSAQSVVALPPGT